MVRHLAVPVGKIGAKRTPICNRHVTTDLRASRRPRPGWNRHRGLGRPLIAAPVNPGTSVRTRDVGDNQ